MGGTIFGYGSQVVRNLGQRICFWDGLSFNISAGEVAMYAGVGVILGFGMGGALVGIQALVASLGTGTVVISNPSLQKAIQNGLYIVTNGMGQGYSTFQAFKYAQGPAGAGMAWHHIVVQTSTNILRFSANSIHNTVNLIKLPQGPGSLHHQISNLYNLSILL